MMPIHFQTPERKIGKYLWRLIVIDSRWGKGERATLCQFRHAPDEFYPANLPWQDQHEWPSYNINDGMYLGLPKSLAKLHEDYRPNIKAALENKPVEDLFAGAV